MSRRLILQQARGQSPGLGSSHCLGAYGFMFYFTPRWGFFSPFPHGTTSLSVTQEYLALQGCSTPPLRLAARRLYSSPTTPFSRFRLLPFRSPLLRESLLLSFPLATKMFQFARLSLACPWIQQQFERLTYSGISGSTLFFNSPEHFVAYYALPHLWVPRYPP
ncbi:hypothetical protein RIF29_43205 [Crotalaria pallida]|uniref:Uncharacterized protein n=1 Tax=Crotalaria pallida TaxID=3830 RepID=A0AAN9DXW0_CROPI